MGFARALIHLDLHGFWLHLGRVHRQSMRESDAIIREPVRLCGEFFAGKRRLRGRPQPLLRESRQPTSEVLSRGTTAARKSGIAGCFRSRAPVPDPESGTSSRGRCSRATMNIALGNCWWTRTAARMKNIDSLNQPVVAHGHDPAKPRHQPQLRPQAVVNFFPPAERKHQPPTARWRAFSGLAATLGFPLTHRGLWRHGRGSASGPKVFHP